MNTFNTSGHFFRVIREGRSLNPNAHLVLLYLYRQFAQTKTNPLLWSYQEAQIDRRTLRAAVTQLRSLDFIQADSEAAYVLTNPQTGMPIEYPEPKKRFDIKTFWFPWFVLDHRRLNATELLVYAWLWSEKQLNVYKPDSAIACETGLSERTVTRCLQSLRNQRLILCVTKERSAFTGIRHKGGGLADALSWADKSRLQPLGIAPVTRIRQITLCDPERPGVKCVPRTMANRWIDFNEIHDGDVRSLLEQLGVRVLHDTGSVLYCAIPGSSECRKVETQTGFSLVPSEARNAKGQRRHVRESIWELAGRYKGEKGLDIVRQWHGALVKRNAVFANKGKG